MGRAPPAWTATGQYGISWANSPTRDHTTPDPLKNKGLAGPPLDGSGRERRRGESSEGALGTKEQTEHNPQTQLEIQRRNRELLTKFRSK